MTFDVNSLLASIVVSGIGFVLFEYGRRQHRTPQLVSGLALLVFPYFVTNIALMAVIALVIIGAVYAAVRFGW